MKSKRVRTRLLSAAWFNATWAVAVSVIVGSSTSSAAIAGASDSAPPGRSIAYAFTFLYWSMYHTQDGKEECPNGINTMGPREQFSALFPDDGTRRKIAETHLAREAEVWWPAASPEPYPIPPAGGKFAIGLDLDGKIKPTDFTSPEGVPGIDNQVFRALGCVRNIRVGGPGFASETENYLSHAPARLLIELTDVDSLLNDDDVTLTTFRGLYPLVIDATGSAFYPGGTQQLDLRFGEVFIHQAKGKIVNGMLVTQPMDFIWPTWNNSQEWMRDARFEIRLTPEKAKGLIGGYVDVETMYYSRNRTRPTHAQAYGQEAQASTYRALKKYADAYPDVETGQNTAISGAYAVEMVQVHVLRPNPK